MPILKPGFLRWDGLKYVTEDSISFSFSLLGDVVGSNTTTTVTKIQGRLISETAPADGYVLTWNATNNDWEPAISSGGGGGITALTGDIRASGSGSISALIYNFANLKTTTLENFGAVGDGVTNDQTAFAAAISALSSGTYKAILLGEKSYLIQGGTLPAGCSISGTGPNSQLKTTSNQSVIIIGGLNCSLSNFRITGNSTGSAQVGIQNGTLGATPGSLTGGFEKFYCTNVIVETTGGTGFQVASTNSMLYGPLFTGCVADTCGGSGTGHGFDIDVAEYTQLVNCCARNGNHGTGQAGLRLASGNVAWVGGDITNNQAGVFFDLTTYGSYSNYAHGVISGCSINHNNAYSVISTNTSVTAGHFFIGCLLYFGDLYLIGTTGICFKDCTIDVGDLIFQGSIGTRFDNCTWPSTVANDYFNSFSSVTSTEIWTGNNLKLDGTKFIPGVGGNTLSVNSDIAMDNIRWTENSVPSISQVARTTDTATNDLTISAQSAYSVLPVNKNGANIILEPGISASGGLTSNVYVAVGTITESNVSGGLIVKKAATNCVKLGVSFSSTGSIWLGSDSLSAPTTSNVAMSSDIGGTVINHAPSSGTASVALVANGGTYLVTASFDSVHGLVKTNGQSQGTQYVTSTDYTIDNTVASSNIGDEEIWMSDHCAITLPNPASWGGRRIRIVVGYNPAAAGGAIKRHGTELINGVASDITLAGNSAFQVFWASTDGTNWIITRPSGTGVAGY